MEDRFEDLPETFDQMMLLPNVPDFRTSHRHLTKIHQIEASGCALLKKEENNREFSRDHKSSEQFVWLNRRHREMETQLARSSVALDHTDSASGGVDLGGFSVYGLPWVV